MVLIAKATGGGDRPLPPIGMQQAVLYSVIDLGTQQNDYMGTIKIQRKLNVAWELPFAPKLKYEDNGKEIERPQCIFKTYTLSLYEKAGLAIDLSGWRGSQFTKAEQNGFDVFSMLTPGANALLNIVHYEGKDGGMKAKYTSIANIMPNMLVCELDNPMVQYSIEEFGDNFPESIPDWCIEDIKKSPEFKRYMSRPTASQMAQHTDGQPRPTDADAAAGMSANDDDIPF